MLAIFYSHTTLKGAHSYASSHRSFYSHDIPKAVPLLLKEILRPNMPYSVPYLILRQVTTRTYVSMCIAFPQMTVANVPQGSSRSEVVVYVCQPRNMNASLRPDVMFWSAHVYACSQPRLRRWFTTVYVLHELVYFLGDFEWIALNE